MYTTILKRIVTIIDWMSGHCGDNGPTGPKGPTGHCRK